MQSSFQTGCPICYPRNIRCKKTPLILLKLAKIMEKEKSRQRKLISLPTQQYFKLLVDYLMLELAESTKIVESCSHRALKGYLTKKMNISVDQLYCFSQHVYNSLSKGKFQLELIEKIAKNIHQRVFKNGEPSNNSPPTQKRKKTMKNKNSSQIQVPTLSSIGNQKVLSNKSHEDQQQFVREAKMAQEINIEPFLESYGFSTVIYGAQQNNYYPVYGRVGFQDQACSYTPQELKVFLENGYFFPILPSFKN